MYYTTKNFTMPTARRLFLKVFSKSFFSKNTKDIKAIIGHNT